MTEPLGQPDDVVPLRSTTLLGPISSAVAHRLWRPSLAGQDLAEWWRPLARLSRRLRADDFPWPIRLDEFHVVGRVDRPPRPRVWIYRHHAAPAELAVDDIGRSYRFVWSSGRRSLGHLREVDTRSAVHRAGLTELIDPRDRSEDWPADLG